MAVLQVFGENLRLLCETRGSQAMVARDLGLSKVQMQRYLRAESFPKPNLLQKICQYFGVDARIMTETLMPQLLADMRAAAGVQSGQAFEVPPGISQGFRYVDVSPRAFDAQDAMSDGAYVFWRNSMSQRGKIARTVVQLKTIGATRVLRGFDPVSAFPKTLGRIPAKLREFRGVMFRQTTGYSVMLFHGAPSWALSHVYLVPVPLMIGAEYLYGFTTLGREEFPHVVRMARVVWQKLPPDMSALMRASRSSGLLAPENVPEYIRDLVLAPLA